MRIVVCVKHVPDAQGDRRFATDHTVDRGNVDGLLCELDEYAVEQALKLAEGSDDATVTVVTVGPDAASDAVRKALQMGADAGVHVLDDAIHGSDAFATSLVLAKTIGTLEYDVVMTGMASTDAGMSVVPALLAARLGLPQVTFAGTLDIDGDGPGAKVVIQRDSDAYTEVIESALPALVSVTDQINEPRYPSFKGIMAAKKKPLTTLSLADLGVDASLVGLAAAWSTVAGVTQRPPRAAGAVVTDEGDGGAKLVEFLTGAKLV
ncbi:MAG: electron transfer flavoprotein subunit beta/FixA family protein [Actinobacteria bacterium]|nr:electron transfer flavoprotein subunit beta/FixA family protein [Actinomycetota bacterium]